MTTESDGTLALAQVKRRFVEAERQLRKLGAASRELRDATARIDVARDGVVEGSHGLREAAGSLRDYVEALEETTTRMTSVLSILEAIDPTRLQAGLEATGGQISDLRVEALHAVGEARQSLEGRLTGIEVDVAEGISAFRQEHQAATSETSSQVARGFALARRAHEEATAAALTRVRDEVEGGRIELQAKVEERSGVLLRGLVDLRLGLSRTLESSREELTRRSRTLGRAVWWLLALQAATLGAVVYLLLA